MTANEILHDLVLQDCRCRKVTAHAIKLGGARAEAVAVDVSAACDPCVARETINKLAEVYEQAAPQFSQDRARTAMMIAADVIREGDDDLSIEDDER